MLKKQEEKKENVNDEAYYAKNIEQRRSKSKNLSLVANNLSEDEGTYKIWSSISDDEEMYHPTHGVMFLKHQFDHLDGKKVFEKFVGGREGEIYEE